MLQSVTEVFSLVRFDTEEVEAMECSCRSHEYGESRKASRNNVPRLSCELKISIAKPPANRIAALTLQGPGTPPAVRMWW